MNNRWRRYVQNVNEYRHIPTYENVVSRFGRPDMAHAMARQVPYVAEPDERLVTPGLRDGLKAVPYDRYRDGLKAVPSILFLRSSFYGAAVPAGAFGRLRRFASSS